MAAARVVRTLRVIRARLRFVSDSGRGVRRLRCGGSFRYLDWRGRPVRDPAVLARIRRLALPPAWTDVWICTRPDGHLQATGRDAKGRKQYRYHDLFRAARDAVKFDSLVDFAKALPRLRARVAEDLARPGLPREKVLAAVVSFLEQTFIRV